MSKNKPGEIRLREAFERLKNNKPVVVPIGSKVNPKNVQLEAEMGDGAVYYYKTLLQEIKDEKKNVTEAKSENKKSEKTTSNKTKQLQEENKRLKKERDAALVAQTELVYNLFQNCSDPKFIVGAYES